MGEDDDILQQSPEIKRKRFEERAKHYLNYNQTKVEEFQSLNNNFKNKISMLRNYYQFINGFIYSSNSRRIEYFD